MKLSYILLLAITALVFAGGCIGQKTQQIIGTPVEITSSGFNPDNLTISAGETITFINRDTRPHWPASDPHPGHNQYPETGGCFKSKFDACRGLSQDETYPFTFNISGTWTYHDHLYPDMKGTIVVR